MYIVQFEGSPDSAGFITEELALKWVIDEGLYPSYKSGLITIKQFVEVSTIQDYADAFQMISDKDKSEPVNDETRRLIERLYNSLEFCSDNLEDSGNAFEDGDNEKAWEYVSVAQLNARQTLEATAEYLEKADV